MGLFRKRESKIEQSLAGQENKDLIGNEITDEQAVELIHDQNFQEIFISTIIGEKRDQDGKLYLEGTVIISNPEDPGVFMKDTPQNRRMFVKNGFSWQERQRGERVLISVDPQEYLNEKIEAAKTIQEKVKNIKTVAITKASRDIWGKLLKEGTAIIPDPVYEELFFEDTPENRVRFIKQGGTWKEKMR